MGWNNKGKGKMGNGLKQGENKEDGPGLNQSRSKEEPKAHMEAAHNQLLPQDLRAKTT